MTDTTVNDIRDRAESVVSDIKATGRDATSAFTEVADTFGDALDDSLRRRPYATLVVAAGIGFLFGAAWMR